MATESSNLLVTLGSLTVLDKLACKDGPDWPDGPEGPEWTGLNQGGWIEGSGRQIGISTIGY